MGLYPTESRDAVGLDTYEPYKCPPTCAVPGCTKWTQEQHHLYSRAKLGAAYDHVRLPDGTEVGNKVPLCFQHHRMVTDNEVRITYMNGDFYWEGQKLTWQPPVMKGRVAPVLDLSRHRAEKQGRTERQVCRECGRALPRAITEEEKQQKKEERKTRKTWAVAVPWTDEEKGADTLDALLEAAREEMDRYGLDWGRGHKVKFHVLAAALALFVSHADKVLSDA